MSDSVLPPDQDSRHPQWFDATQWSMILRAGQCGSPGYETALAKLCGIYWKPIFAFVRRSGCSREQAEDMTQEFFLHLFHKNALARADRERGRFRSFLLTALKNFLANQHEFARAEKRGGKCVLMSLDEIASEDRLHDHPTDDLSPDRVFLRRWANVLMDKVLANLRREEAEQGKEKLFDALQGQLTMQSKSASYAEIAVLFNTTEDAIKAKVYRLRSQFGTLLLKEIRDTVTDEAEIEDELRYLMAAFG